MSRKIRSHQGFTLIEIMIVVVIIGILSAVAVPAFLKFIRKSKTSEASVNIKAIGDGAVAYFDVAHSNTVGDALPKHFPNNQSPTAANGSLSYAQTPSAQPCSGAGGMLAQSNGKPQYTKDSSRWEVQPWKSLKFGINRAHYYQYWYQSRYLGNQAKFWISAFGNLDCDTTQSTFEVKATVNVQTGEVERSQMIINNALE